MKEYTHIYKFMIIKDYINVYGYEFIQLKLMPS